MKINTIPSANLVDRPTNNGHRLLTVFHLRLKMPTCAVLNCCLTKDGLHKKTYHRFPFSNPEVMKLWVLALNRGDWVPKKSSLICSYHFEESVIDRTGQTVRLREGAVPTIFVCPASSAKIAIKRRVPRGPRRKKAESYQNNVACSGTDIAKSPVEMNILEPCIELNTVSIKQEVCDDSNSTSAMEDAMNMLRQEWDIPVQSISLEGPNSTFKENENSDSFTLTKNHEKVLVHNHCPRLSSKDVTDRNVNLISADSVADCLQEAQSSLYAHVKAFERFLQLQSSMAVSEKEEFSSVKVGSISTSTGLQREENSVFKDHMYGENLDQKLQAEKSKTVNIMKKYRIAQQQVQRLQKRVHFLMEEVAALKKQKTCISCYNQQVEEDSSCNVMTNVSDV